MLAFKPLLAVDWIEILIFLFIVSSSLIGQLFKAAQQQKKKGVRPKPQPNVPPAVGNAPQGPPAAGRPETSLEKEIEAFLRKNLGGKKPPQTPPKTQKTPARPASRQTGRRPQSTQRPAPQPPRRQTTADFPARETVGEHVQRHIQQGGVSQRDAHLGEQLGQTDERMESHLHDVFEHRLGTLEGEDARMAAIQQGTDADIWAKHQAANPMTAQLYEMLSTPQHVRAAIILAEVLRRPEDRWS